MRAQQALEAMRRFPCVELDDALGEGGLVVIAPHPDDESLACGGLIARACREGRSVRVVVVSDGTGSHPRSRAYPRLRLRGLREAEARRAVGALGLAPRHLVFLRLPDRFVPHQGAGARAAVERIVEAARKADASALFVSWRHDPHCDHQAAFRLARSAQQRLGARLFEYTVWGPALKPLQPVTPVTSGFRLFIGRERSRKRRAVAAHASQTTGLIVDDPAGFQLTGADLARFSGPFEAFVAAGE
jgi:LmbE family N-acetylglucosaminyl deacetylase